MKIIAVTQARMGSSRLPNKILKKVGDKSLLRLHINRVLLSKKINKFIVATTVEDQDVEVVDHVKKLNVETFRGSENDVLDRFYQAVKNENADFIVRLTSDCPLLDAKLVDSIIEYTLKNDLDYCSNTLDPKYPDGQDVEIFKFSALEKAWKEATLLSDREHVTPYIWRNSSYKGGTVFLADNYEEGLDYGSIRMTVDEPQDYELICLLVDELGETKEWIEYARFIQQNEKAHFNQNIIRNEGFLKSLKKDNLMKTGQELYKKAKTLIPGGTMLLSKRPEMFLPEQWPSYYSKAKGCKVWDLDGKEYLDMSIMGIGTNTLGYGNEQVDEAVRAVVAKGNMSTFNCPEEVELAERLVAMHPWGDMMRFCRTGGEANAVAIRIARAASGKDKVAICGYHGWHDWYISTNISEKGGLSGHLLPGLEPAGVPKGLAGTTLPFMYNDIEAVKELIHNNPDLGVLKMEVSRNHGPAEGYLEEIRSLTKKHGIILIFDECTSGFRETFGGLHKKFGVEPDMAMFGKALGNGYAITGVLGTKEVMQAAQKTFISSTFWTERIGPAAALATLDVMKEKNSWDIITKQGEKITAKWKELGGKYGLELSTAGLSALTTFSIKSNNWLAYKTYLTQEMLKKGILAANGVYVCTEHTDEHIERYFHELDSVFANIRSFEDGKDVYAKLEGPVCHGGFKRLN